jgi:S1-C subfamily serine protease
MVKSRLGVVVGPVTEDQAASDGLKSPVGVTIHWVDPNGPFGKVGFEEGDLILAIDNVPKYGVDTFLNKVTSLPHHQKVVLLGLDHRTGKTSYVKVEIP